MTIIKIRQKLERSQLLEDRPSGGELPPVYNLYLEARSQLLLGVVPTTTHQHNSQGIKGQSFAAAGKWGRYLKGESKRRALNFAYKSCPNLWLTNALKHVWGRLWAAQLKLNFTTGRAAAVATHLTEKTFGLWVCPNYLPGHIKHSTLFGERNRSLSLNNI